MSTQHETGEVECFACGAAGMGVFYRAEDVPVHSCVLLPTRKEALAFPTGDIAIAFCESCGFIQNTLFDAARLDYSQNYEETQGFSPHFNGFVRSLAEHLVGRYDLHDRQILEIGGGKGQFLELLCDLGPNRGIGIDPSYLPERASAELASRITTIRDFYSDAFAHLTGDLVVCRHTLEHIAFVADFAGWLRSSAAGTPGAVTFLEVPETRRVLRELAFWDIYYEHCSYFSVGSLTRLAAASGFDVIEARLGFGDQYILLEASVSNGSKGESFAVDDLEDMTREVNTFAHGWEAKLDEWRSRLEIHKAGGGRAAIWGAGSKGVAFLSTLAIEDAVDVAVDINPFKQGTYLAGTGQPVIGPDALVDYRPDLVIIMNPVYMDEIAGILKDLGVRAELLGLGVD